MNNDTNTDKKDSVAQSKDASSISNSKKSQTDFTKNQTPLTQEKLKRMVIVAITGSLLAGYAGGYYGGKHQIQSNGSSQVSRQVIDSESALITDIAKNVGESVVSIDVSSRTRTDSFFGTRSYTQQSAGTGFVIDADKGIVITNRHVIPSGTTSVSITLSDGTQLTDVSVIGRTNDSDSLDVAFLKIGDKKGKTLKTVKLADSSKVQVGDKVVAIGNALGQFQNTVTSGIISGYGRSIEAGDDEGSSESLQNLFQTDTAINQGNSGGPLVNLNSEVIGINTAIAGNAENIGFSIPINDVQGLIKSVINNGKLQRPYLGVRYVNLTDDYAYQYNLGVKRGAYIAPSSSGSSIVDNSPASKAGLKEKDIIIKVNDQKIDDKNSLVSVLGRFSVGDKVTLLVNRDGKDINIQATLEASPDN